MIRWLTMAILLAGGGLLLHAPAEAAFGKDGRPVAAAPGEDASVEVADLSRTFKSCRRKVRRALGVPRGAKKFRLPRAYLLLIDRCVANNGVYS